MQCRLKYIHCTKKAIGLVILLICTISFNIRGLAQFDLVSATVEKSVDSVWAYPSYLAADNQNVLAQKILNISSAERQWEQVKKQNNRALEVTALLDLSDAYLAFGKEYQAYTYLSNVLKLKRYLNPQTDLSHLYYNLAVIMAHLKQYPLAMEAFNNTKNIIPDFSLKRKRRKFKVIDSVFHFAQTTELSSSNESDELQSSKELDEALLSIDTTKILENLSNEESIPIVLDSILYAFDDGKKASTYAIVVHIKQPVTGKKKLLAHFTYVGHMFISLIKYNEDESVVSRTFGLYPETGFLFSATPLFPKTEPLYKNDAKHNWDELLGKFISGDQFNKILDYIDQTGSNAYHLNSNNCSDFALTIATIAGIEISDTKGNWILGSGNNPAFAGQSVLAAKYKNYETNSREGILACTNNLFLKLK